MLISYFAGSSKSKKYLESIELGSDWFLSNQSEDFIYYEYHIDRNYHTKENNNLKKMWALRTIAKSANFLNNDALSQLANKGLIYYEYFMDYDDNGDFYYINVGWEDKNIGYSAYAILSLLEMEHPKKDEYIEKFAAGILSQQLTNGRLNEYFYSQKLWNQNFYPGLALYALMEAYEYNENKEYLTAVQNAFSYYKMLWESEPTMWSISQFSRAFNKLYEATDDDEVATFVKSMNNYLLKQHKPQQDCWDFQFKKWITTAIYMEWVISAYETAKANNDRESARCYKNYVQEAAEYIVNLQVVNKEKYELPALWGFLSKTMGSTVRVERNQHAVMALMEAYEIGMFR